MRCDNPKCRHKESARGEFFKNYKGHGFLESFILFYAFAHRWPPRQVMNELKFRSRARCSAMIMHMGAIAEFASGYLFKHSLGRWPVIVADEAASGQSKKTKNHSAKPGSKKGLRWWESICNATETIDDDGNVRRKTTGFFYERILPLAYTTRNGEEKYKHRTKESLCWHIVRLAAWGGKVVTDCAKGYLPLGDYWRPDIDHRDNNHSKGFNVCGPKSIAAGATNENSNLGEGGGHATLYKLLRGWLGKKIGSSGSDEYEGLVKDLVVMMMNCNYSTPKKDILQELFLWMRFKYGTMHPTVLEKNLCRKMDLEIRPVPDYEAVEATFLAINLEEEPWPFTVGPELPELRKGGSTAPFNWTARWGNYRHAHWAALELEAEAAVKAGPDVASPVTYRNAGAVPLSELTSPHVGISPAKRPQQKRPRTSTGKGKAPAVFASSNANPAAVAPTQTPHYAPPAYRQSGLFGFKYETPPPPPRRGAEVAFHPRHAAAVVDCGGVYQPRLSPFGFVNSPRNKEAKEESSRTGEARAGLIDMTNTDKPAVSFHARHGTAVVDGGGMRQSRLSPFGFVHNAEMQPDKENTPAKAETTPAKAATTPAAPTPAVSIDLTTPESAESRIDLTSPEFAPGPLPVWDLDLPESPTPPQVSPPPAPSKSKKTAEPGITALSARLPGPNFLRACAR